MSGAGGADETSGERRESGRFYRCFVDECARELRFSHVEILTADYSANGGMARLLITYRCECGELPLKGSYPPDKGAILRLVGKLRPKLPYSAAPSPSARMSRERSELVAQMRGRLTSIVGAEDFLAACQRDDWKRGQ